MKLRLEHLEAREVPALTTLADVRPFYAPDFDPMPGAPDHMVGIVSHPSDAGKDVYVGTGPGAGARLTIRDNRTGETLLDTIVYDESFRGGIEAAAGEGDELFLTPGEGGGNDLVAVDLTTLTVRHILVPFPADWRGGMRITSADIDAVNGDPSPDPEEELLLLPGGDAGGAHLVILEPTGEVRRSFVFGPEGFRGGLDFVPAGAGVLLSHGGRTLGMGVAVQPAGQRPDPVTFTVAYTIGVTWDGDWYEERWDTSKFIGEAHAVNGQSWEEFYGVEV